MNTRQQLFVDLYCSGMSATEAYIKAGYKEKDAGKRAYILRKNETIAELIEQKKAENSQKVEDKLAFYEDKALDKLIEIADMAMHKDTIFAIIKACQDILDRRRGKPKQQLEVEGGLDNTYRIIVEGVDISKFPNGH